MKNKRIHKKLKGFTMLEVLVAMVISGIVFSIAGLCFSILQSRVNDFSRKDNRIKEGFHLREIMAYDIFKSDNIKTSYDGIKMEGKNFTVEYRFSENYILREFPHATDTFHVKNAVPKKIFAGKEVTVPEKLVGEISFEGELSGTKTYFHFVKDYGADVLIKETQESR